MESKEVAKIITELQQPSLVDIMTPNQLSNYLLIMSAHIFKAGSNITEAEIEYAKRWNTLRIELGSDKQAEMALKAYPEYKALQEAKYAEKTLLECIRAVKKYLAVKIEEGRSTF